MIDWKSIDHVTLTIPPGAETEAREFYTSILGFDEVPRPESFSSDGGMWFRAGEIELHISVEDGEHSRSKRHPAFEIGNVNEVRSYLEKKGFETQDEPPISGIERFSFRDPFENRIELLTISE
ncbi:VOC family protein [Haladaptatus sp. CMAA 1911]|uniref:VOC family protein n=1 Tax=unclassified Haladaptatus TaxID=2622732 RepID=UPI0037546C53